MGSRAGAWLGVLVAAAALVAPRTAGAFEFFDGRLQVHGFGESIIRVLNNDFDDVYQLSQMQFLLNLEVELDIAPDGFGPFSALSAYARLEARYDCIWRNTCWISSHAVDHVGDNITRVARFKSNGREMGFTGTSFGNSEVGLRGRKLQNGRQVARINEAGPFETLFEVKGPDFKLGTNDDPAPLIFGNLQYYRVSFRKVPGSLNGQGTQILLPLRPRDKVGEGIGRFRTFNNGVSPLEPNTPCQVSKAQPPQGCRFGFEIAAPFGSLPVQPTAPPGTMPGDLYFDTENVKPFRPWPRRTAMEAAAGHVPLTEASGLYSPSWGLRKFLMDEGLQISSFDQDFSQSSLAWNHGASQREERELKELYFDIEMLDGRLWVRLGKQTIVWGKTEIFRSQDQFNPQDLGLATLPSLEESRIALWAARAVYSFYDVGPFQDVRLELAALLDEYEPADLGRCGEPFSPLPVFGKCLGIVAHSVTGLGVAAEVRPKDWWQDASGLEFGARLEFRWSRFSFALTDFYGYDDTPYTDVIFKYERNVDPRTGRPRFAGTDLPCGPGDTRGCLGNTPRDPLPDFSGLGVLTFSSWETVGGGGVNSRIEAQRRRLLNNPTQKEILERHHANQTFYNFACAAATGFTDIVPSVVTECGVNIFGSAKVIETPFAVPFNAIPLVSGISMVLGGSSSLFELAVGFLSEEASGLLTVVPLNHNDMGPRVCVIAVCALTPFDPRSRTHEGFGTLRPTTNGLNFLFAALGSASSALTPEQQALLGCGAYYGSSCDRQGLDLLNAEASALFQSWPGFDGTPFFYNMLDKGTPGPGTVGFQGGPVCTRYERGKTFMLPGCRGPEDPGYDPTIDGVPYFSEWRNNNPSSIDDDSNPATPPFPVSDLRNFDAISTKNGCRSILRAAGPPGPAGDRLRSDMIRLFNPVNCQPFRSEMAALSFNFLAVAILFSGDSDNDGFSKPEDFDEFDPSRPFATDRCSIASPQFCSVVRSLLGATGVGRNNLKAGGSFEFGRRDFAWHSGQELVLRYNRRNVLGFSMDVAEDYTKTNWSFEATWFNEVPFADRNAINGINKTDVYNLTISVDRPTFVNFLNSNRTFLFNSQAFISYVPDHDNGFSSNGPFNVLMTFTTISGYFQDRLLTVVTFVYDFMSESGAGLPSLTYRFTEAFSAQFGMAFFFGKYQDRVPFLMPPALGNRVGRNAYRDYVENGLSLVRDRDEFFFRIRYTF